MLAAVLGANLPGSAHAGTWPERPIRLVIGYTPGGAADQTVRDLAPLLQQELGQPVVVDYKPGAGGTIAADAVAKAAPDGYTIGLVDSAPLTIAPHLRRVPYDPQKDFTPIGGVSRGPLVVLVHPSVQARNVGELIALAASRPSGLPYSSAGPGTLHHLAGELFRTSTHAAFIHVPYKGAGPALTDLMGGQIPLSFVTLGAAMPFMASGKVRAIAVTSARRSSAFPDVPTLAEQGVKGYDVSGWLGVVGPAGLPPDIVARLNGALARALSNPNLRAQLARLGAEPMPCPPQTLTTLIATDDAKWAKVIRDGHIRVD